ncbi:MAG: sensor histidine kinase [Candidatus Omnitrophota bacterium]
MPRRITIDWRMVAGFLGLLFLIIAVGLIGIRQIENLSSVVSYLAKTDMPMQNAVLEMKSSNSKYAMGIRNYMFWRSAKYLEAASVAQKLDLVRLASANFDKHLAFYALHAELAQEREWVRIVRESETELRKTGDTIIAMIDKAEGDINKHLMDFEGKLFQIDAYLDDPLQKSVLSAIDNQLAVAETGKRRSVVLLWWSLLVGLLLGAQTAYLIYRRSKREQEHRELLWRQVIRVEEEQRNNLSLQIHDQMGQDLSALKIYLGLLERDLAPEMKEQKERIEKTKKILDGLMDKTHNISELLRPPELDDLGLSESIAALILQYKEMTGNNYNYERLGQDALLSPEHSLILYRVVQEALTNIAKYSEAKNVEVSLEKKDDLVALIVSDDGKGFDYDEYLRRPGRRKDDKIKIGLQGLRERIELIGGVLRVYSKPGQGTKLEVTLPV